MTPYIIKLIAELIVLIVLWAIARKQEELQYDIYDSNKKVDMLRGELFQLENSLIKANKVPEAPQEKGTLYISGVPVNSTTKYNDFKSKLKSEEKRMNNIVQTSKVAKKKVTKK